MPDQIAVPPKPLDEKEVNEKIASLGIDLPSESKPKYTKLILIILAAVAVVGAVPLTVYLVGQRQEIRKEAIQDQFQCVSGCDGRVCEAQDTGYTWCSTNSRCVCTGPGQAAAHSDQYWCEGQNTMYCGEISSGNCGTKVDSQNRKYCGGDQPISPFGQCTHYSDCFNTVECEWTASTYCINGQCVCADVEQQRLHGGPLGWAFCEDTEPRCTPDACPADWQDCGLNYSRTDNSSACVKKVKCGPVSCEGCENTYVVWRYCKPGAPTSTPRQPANTPTATPTGTTTLTVTPSVTRIPTITPTGTVQPTPTATVTPTPTSTTTPRPGATNTPTPTAVTTIPESGFTLPTLGALLGGIALVIGSLLVFL